MPHVIVWSIWRGKQKSFKMLKLETPFQRLEDKFIKNIYFREGGKFSSSSFEVVDLMDSLYIGCIYSFV